MGDFKQSKEVLLQILRDYGYDDEDSRFDENYYEKRITDLNRIVRKEFDAKNRLEKRNSKLMQDIKKLKGENKRLKEKNKEILSSKSWKITKPLRDLRNK